MEKGDLSMNSTMIRELNLPRMKIIHQHFDMPSSVDVSAELDREWNRLKDRLNLSPGMNIAVCVGSRDISNLTTVVRAAVTMLQETGCDPFITTAMGSHGGATVEGQTQVLAIRGITEESVGAPIHATMDVVPMGEIDGIPLFLDRLAYEADGIVLVNRIKPHTNFIGPTESGWIKMIAIGLGNQIGAEHYHRLSLIRDQYHIISTAGKELIKRSKVLFSVGLVENQEHETVILKMASADEIEAVETELCSKARSYMPRLPLNEIDLLIVDEMGKDISGEGIDPNVVGRDVCSYGARRPLPAITRIFVRDLTEGTEGSALGVGQADFTVQRLVDKIDFQVTAINSLTACCPEAGKMPLAYPNDRDAIAAAMMTLRPCSVDDVRIVHIKNTMDLKKLLVSQGCVAELEGKPGIEISDEYVGLQFDRKGNLISNLMS
jgi:hypothetical protein